MNENENTPDLPAGEEALAAEILAITEQLQARHKESLPEQRLLDLARDLLRDLDGPAFPGRQHKIRNTACQLAEDLLAYFQDAGVPVSMPEDS